MAKINVWIIVAVAVFIVVLLVFVGQILGNSKNTKETIGNFIIDSNSEVCTELNRSIIYIFGSQSCPHCLWEDPILKNVTANFKGLISFHENIDNSNDREIFSKYSPQGYIPLVVIGCKYYRVGSGESLGADQESKVLTALICSLTNKEPSNVCSEVEDLINQIG
jgi:thiol-disulfide isomerase/thioredoxin